MASHPEGSMSEIGVHRGQKNASLCLMLRHAMHHSDLKCLEALRTQMHPALVEVKAASNGRQVQQIPAAIWSCMLMLSVGPQTHIPDTKP